MQFVLGFWPSQIQRKFNISLERGGENTCKEGLCLPLKT